MTANKYRAIRAYRCGECGGTVHYREQACLSCGKLAVISFDSRAEARRYDELRQSEALGLISDLKRQVPFPITVNGQDVAVYRADFIYTENGVLVVEDVKSGPTKTAEYKLKKKLVKAVHGVTITEVMS